jgi:hypothetical protein
MQGIPPEDMPFTQIMHLRTSPTLQAVQSNDVGYSNMVKVAVYELLYKC